MSRVFDSKVLIVALAAIIPFLAGDYYTILAISIMAYTIALLGLNLLFGYGGLLSFGHAMFVAIGAYSGAILGTKLGIKGFELQLLTGIAASFAVAAVVGLVCIRYTTIFFSMLTLSFGMIFHSILFKLYGLTGGESGISVARPTLFGFPATRISKTAFLVGPFYWYTLVLFAALLFLMSVIVRSPFGIALQAARDNQEKTTHLGISVGKVRYVAFIISALYCSVGGAILAVSIGASDPELAYWTQSGLMIFMIILGGVGQLLGPMIGSVAFTLFQDVLMANTQYWRFALGFTLALVIVLAPKGLLGMITRARHRKA